MTINLGEAPGNQSPATDRWPGWPGENAFRMIVPVVKVGSIIGRGGDRVKKLCDETRARVRVLDGPLSSSDRVVLISGKEEPESTVSPAMEAAFRIFKRVNGMSNDGTTTEFGTCSVRLLIASIQALHLIGKQGSLVKSIQEESGASIRIHNGDAQAYYASEDERIADIQGETLKVLKALEIVLGHLRRFLVDRSVIPLFEKNLNNPDGICDHRQSLIHSPQQTGIGNDYSLSLKRDSLFLERELQRDSLHRGSSPFRQDPALSASRFSGLGRTAGSFVTQITQTMEIPLIYAEDVIGSGGCNIAYIRARSGASIAILESGKFDEITLEIKGTLTQMQTAQQLIEDSITGRRESAATRSGPAFSQSAGPAYPSSSLPTQTFGSSDLETFGERWSSGLGSFRDYRF